TDPHAAVGHEPRCPTQEASLASRRLEDRPCFRIRETSPRLHLLPPLLLDPQAPHWVLALEHPVVDRHRKESVNGVKLNIDAFCVWLRDRLHLPLPSLRILACHPRCMLVPQKLGKGPDPL